MWLLLGPIFAVAMGGWTECELPDPFVGIVEVSGNGLVWGFSDMVSGYVEWNASAFVGSDVGCFEEPLE